VVIVFWGSSWNDPPQRETAAAIEKHVAALEKSPDYGVLIKHGVEAGRLAVQSQKNFSDPPRHPQVCDLEIQAELARLFSVGELRKPSPEIVFLVVLPPGIHSSLGGNLAGNDYLAYHNHFHLEAGQVRYVVAPYGRPFGDFLSATDISLFETIINPEGNSSS
jgi:hypothetical protein